MRFFFRTHSYNSPEGCELLAKKSGKHVWEFVYEEIEAHNLRRLENKIKNENHKIKS